MPFRALMTGVGYFPDSYKRFNLASVLAGSTKLQCVEMNMGPLTEQQIGR